MPKDDTQLEPLVHTVSETARLLNTWNGKVYGWINSGVVRAVMISGKWKIPHSEVLRIAAEGDGSTTRRGDYAYENHRRREPASNTNEAEGAK